MRVHRYGAASVIRQDDVPRLSAPLVGPPGRELRVIPWGARSISSSWRGSPFQESVAGKGILAHAAQAMIHTGGSIPRPISISSMSISIRPRSSSILSAAPRVACSTSSSCSSRSSRSARSGPWRGSELVVYRMPRCARYRDQSCTPSQGAAGEFRPNVLTKSHRIVET